MLECDDTEKCDCPICAEDAALADYVQSRLDGGVKLSMVMTSFAYALSVTARAKGKLDKRRLH